MWSAAADKRVNVRRQDAQAGWHAPGLSLAPHRMVFSYSKPEWCQRWLFKRVLHRQLLASRLASRWSLHPGKCPLVMTFAKATKTKTTCSCWWQEFKSKSGLWFALESCRGWGVATWPISRAGYHEMICVWSLASPPPLLPAPLVPKQRKFKKKGGGHETCARGAAETQMCTTARLWPTVPGSLARQQQGNIQHFATTVSPCQRKEATVRRFGVHTQRLLEVEGLAVRGGLQGLRSLQPDAFLHLHAQQRMARLAPSQSH